MALPLVLASGSSARHRLLVAAGYDVTVVVPGVAEDDLQARLAELGPEEVAVRLARRKAAAVGDRPGAVVLAADQVGVLDGPGSVRLLAKPRTAEDAVRQLMAMSGTTHRLVNGIAAVGPDGAASAVDVVEVEMTAYDEDAARRYVAAHQPFDTAGGYRIEDGAGLVREIRGSGRDAVMGLPLAVVGPLLARLGVPPPGPGPGIPGR